jgi:hypothetical protein
MITWGYDRESGNFGMTDAQGRVVRRRFSIDDFTSSEAVLDYIAQQTPRIDDADAGRLVRALDGLLGLQENYCSAGMSGYAGKKVADPRTLAESRQMTEKQCSECKRTKPLDAFYKSNNAKDGRQGRCKACDKERSSARGRGER